MKYLKRTLWVLLAVLILMVLCAVAYNMGIASVIPVDLGRYK